MKRFVQTKVILALSFLFTLLVWGPAARWEINKSKAEEDYTMSQETRVGKVLQVLEKKIGNQTSLGKAKEKGLALFSCHFSFGTNREGRRRSGCRHCYFVDHSPDHFVLISKSRGGEINSSQESAI